MSQKFDELLKKRDGNLSIKEARSKGISPSTVQPYVKSGRLLAIERGFYILDGHGIDELYSKIDIPVEFFHTKQPGYSSIITEYAFSNSFYFSERLQCESERSKGTKFEASLCVERSF